MPVLRYFVVVGFVLLGGLFAADYMLPKPQAAVAVAGEADAAVANWRAAEARKSINARSAAANNFTLATSPAFGVPGREPIAPAMAVTDVSARSENNETKGEAKTSGAKTSGVKTSGVKTSETRPASNKAAPGRAARFVPPPSADSLRQDAMARAAAQRHFATQPPATPPWSPGLREASARMPNPFARMW